MAKYSVKSKLKHGGKHYAPGKTVELDDETATPLLEDGVIEAPAAKGKAEKAGE